MRHHHTIAVVIPALNEAGSIGRVLDDIPEWVDDVVIADNGSTDGTAKVAERHGARVVREDRRGYGSACLAGIAALDRPDIVVFLDADYSDYPDEMALLVDPITEGEAELVIGSRTLGEHEPGALTLQARFGNALSCLLIRHFWGVRYSDLGPFRAIRYAALERLNMGDPDYGWTVEMQIKAAQQGLRVAEAPVRYRRRIGKSKISGTVRGCVGAGSKILGKIFASLLERRGTRRRCRKECLIVYSRFPKAGTTKTRLIPRLGASGAAELQRQMTEHALTMARRLRLTRPVDIEVHFAQGDAERMRSWLGNDLRYAPQSSGDLGERMHARLSDALRRGARRAVLVGTDCPGIDAALLAGAFDALVRSDVVFGPASDGGYYLVGAKRPLAFLFTQMTWSTERVLHETLFRARRAGIALETVAALDDVDRPEDLEVWRRIQRERAQCPRISIVIPALNEERAIVETIRRAQGSSPVELIVVDGGSTDRTREVASAAGANVLAGPRGRAQQMNFGAAATSGKVLLFLHADTYLPRDFERHIGRALSDPRVVGGAFEMRIRGDAPGLRLVERVVSWRSRRLGMPYGDQALFVRSEVFRRVGGYPRVPIMEDVQLVRRMKSHGRLVILPAMAATSGRRWQRLGVARTTAVNWMSLAAYKLGVSPAWIARWYRRW